MNRLILSSRPAVRIFAGILLAAGLVGCSRVEAPSSSQQQSIQSSAVSEVSSYPVDVFGIEADSQPVRVVSLSPAITELLCAFGYGDRLFGVSSACDYPEMVCSLPWCGSALLPDFEQIAEISPDYLLTETPLQTDDYWALQDLDIEVVEIPAPQYLEQVLELYRDICILMDGASTGAQTGDMLVDLYTQQTAVLQEKVSEDPLGNSLSAIFIIDPKGIAAAEDTLYHELMSLMGLTNLWEDGTAFYEADGREPDLILYGDNISKEDIQHSEAFGKLEAVQAHRMFSVPLVPLERASPRMFDMLEQLAKQIYTMSWD